MGTYNEKDPSKRLRIVNLDKDGIWNVSNVGMNKRIY